MKLTVYLLPDRGPISPVYLDLHDIFGTMTPSRPADGLSGDQLRPLCDAIRAHHKRVKPESNLAGLARIYANFGHADRFDGVVLRVEGETEPEPDGHDDPLRAALNEIARRDVEMRRLRGELRQERQARTAAESMVTDLTGRVERLTRELSRVRSERDQARTKADALEATLKAQERELEQVRWPGDVVLPE